MDLTYLQTVNKELHKPAIISGTTELSYKDFFAEVSRYSEYLQSIGLRENHHCAILSDNCVEFIFLIHAIWNCRAIAVPLNVRLLDKELSDLIIHSESRFLFLSEKYSKRIPDLAKTIKRIDFPFKKNYGLISFSNKANIQPDRTALIIYTSGTTSSPKGVMLSFNNLISSSEAAGELLEFSSEDRWLASLPFYHIGGLSIFIRAFLNNASVIIPKSLSIEHIITSIKKNNPTLASFVPTVLKRIVEKKNCPDTEFRYLLLGGGPSDNKLISEAISLGWNIVKVYGSTETSSMVTGFIVKDNIDKINSSGLPLENNVIKIVNANNEIQPAGKPGQIVIYAASVMQGYWNNETETGEVLVNGEFYSGDSGYIDDEGYLYVQTRISDLIISGGENINPDEVEEVILMIPGVQEVSVYGLPDNEWGQIPAAAIIADDLSELAVISFLKLNLASYKIPKKIFFVEELPKNSLGKVIKEQLINRMEHR